eukprot:2966441-Prorocentrum_lima.AAC.1
MTSSLVGSEMCIRDRLHAVPPSVAAAYAAAVGLVGRVGRVLGRIGEKESVSYTHLTLPTICSV